jgi:histidine triad (HIT) family protein
MTDCVFCRIISGGAPAKRIYEDAEVLVIEDLHPRAHHHYLVIPKEHIASLLEVEDA